MKRKNTVRKIAGNEDERLVRRKAHKSRHNPEKTARGTDQEVSVAPLARQAVSQPSATESSGCPRQQDDDAKGDARALHAHPFFTHQQERGPGTKRT